MKPTPSHKKKNTILEGGDFGHICMVICMEM